MKILLLEDEPEILNVLVDFYQASFDGHAEATKTLKKGIESALKRKYDLISLDLRLPDGNGLDFLKRIREDDSPNINTPVIILSGFIPKAVNDLDDPYLTVVEKPFNPEELLDIIQKMALNK